MPKAATALIADPANLIWMSAASVWEIAIKARLGRIDVDVHELEPVAKASGFEALAVTCGHAAAVAALPMHHHDPFDRLLVAQSVVEDLRLLTHDASLSPYGPSVMVA